MLCARWFEGSVGNEVATGQSQPATASHTGAESADGALAWKLRYPKVRYFLGKQDKRALVPL